MGDPKYTPLQRSHRWWLRHEIEVLRPFVIVGLLLILVFLFTGCASTDYQWKQTRPASLKPWFYVVVPDADFVCRTMGADPQRRLERINACATWKPVGCIIYLPENAPQWLVLHEANEDTTKPSHCGGWTHP